MFYSVIMRRKERWFSLLTTVHHSWGWLGILVSIPDLPLPAGRSVSERFFHLLKQNNSQGYYEDEEAGPSYGLTPGRKVLRNATSFSLVL